MSSQRPSTVLDEPPVEYPWYTILSRFQIESLLAIHTRYVHRDPAPKNWPYNPENKHMVFFDLERAEIIKPRLISGMTSLDYEHIEIEHGGLNKKH